MAELPRTEDLPHHPEPGVDPARVEEAFAEFGDRVRELESVAAELRAELRALRAERPLPYAGEDWPAEPYDGPPADWVAAIPPPLARAVAVPRLALEAAFILLVALFAGLADLSVPWIVLVVAAAWALVALSEWAAALRRVRWRLEEIPAPLAPPAADGDTTGPWDVPVVEATVIEGADGSDAHTVVAKLPQPEDPAAEPEVEPPVLPEPVDAGAEPKPRRGFFRRRRAVAGDAAGDGDGTGRQRGDHLRVKARAAAASAAAMRCW